MPQLPTAAQIPWCGTHTKPPAQLCSLLLSMAAHPSVPGTSHSGEPGEGVPSQFFFSPLLSLRRMSPWGTDRFPPLLHLLISQIYQEALSLLRATGGEVSSPFVFLYSNLQMAREAGFSFKEVVYICIPRAQPQRPPCASLRVSAATAPASLRGMLVPPGPSARAGGWVCPRGPHSAPCPS